MRQRNALREAIDFAADQLDAVAMLADGHDLEPPLFGRFDYLPGITIVDADHRGAVGYDQRIEKMQFGREIGFERSVIIEMVARQIREGAGRDPHAIKPVLIEAMRRGLERQMRDAL